jgi:hypothetical protein
MKEKTSPTILYPILGSLLGMISGFTIFIITENFIFLILSITIGLTLGISLGQMKEDKEAGKKE